MRALFVTGKLEYGGAERHAITLVDRLAQRGHECHAVYVKAAQSQLLSELSAAASLRGLDARRYLDRAAVRAFATHVARLQPDVVVAANAYALLYARLALQRSAISVPLVATLHATAPQCVKERLQMLCYRPLFWSADCVVFVCHAQRRYWQRRGLWGRRNEVIYNGVDPQHWRPRSLDEKLRTRRTLGLADGDFVVGLCAVLRPEKNHVQLVEATAALLERGIPARALFIGDGPTRSAIEARARSAGISAHVLITGLQKDVRPLLGACDVVVLCSLTETFSIAALEAMALAKPVVLSEVGGAAEMIRPGHSGFLFPVADTQALTARLAALASSEAREAIGAAARATVQAHFDERSMVDRYERLLLTLESTRRNRGKLRTSAPAH